MAMATQVLHKSTKQNIYRYQACWDINNFSTFYPKPTVHAESKGRPAVDWVDPATFAATAPLSPFGIGLYPALAANNEGDCNKLSNSSPDAEKLNDKVIELSTLNFNIGTNTPAAKAEDATWTGAGDLPQQKRIPAKLDSPEFKFRIGKTIDFIESSLKLFAVPLEDNSGDFKLMVEATVFWTKTEYNESWDGSIQIDLINTDGEVVATPVSSVILPSQSFRKQFYDFPHLGTFDSNRPAFQSKVGVPDTLGTIWDKQNIYFADDVLRIRVSLTLFGKIFNEEEPFTHEREKPNGAAIDRFTKDMLILLESEAGADVTLICKKTKYDAHSAILSARCPVLAKMIKAASPSKTDNGKIELQIKDMQPLVLRSVLRYLYATEFRVPGGMSRMAWISQMLKAADKFELDEIKPLCYDTIRANLRLDNCGVVAVKAWDNDADSKSKRIISDYLTRNWNALTEDLDFVTTVKENPEVFATQTTARALKATEAEKAAQKKNKKDDKDKKKKSGGLFGF